MKKDNAYIEQKILGLLARLVDPLSTDDNERIESFGISAKSFNEVLRTILEKAELIASDVTDVFNPKQLYKFGHNLIMLEGGGMSSEIVELVTEENAFKEFEALRSDKDFVLKVVQTNPNLLEFASDNLKADKSIIKCAVQKNGYALKFASLNIKNDPEIALIASSHKYFSGFEFTPESFKDDKNFVLKVVGENKANLKHVSDRLKDDRDVALAAVRPNEYPLKFLSDKLNSDNYIRYVAFSKPDETLLKESIKPSKDDIIKNPNALLISEENLKDDKDFILELLKIDGSTLMHVSERLRDDDQIVFAAERQRPGMYVFASERLKAHYKKETSYSEKHDIQNISLFLNWKKFDHGSDFSRDQFKKKDFIRLDGSFWLSDGNGFNGDLALYKAPLDYDIEEAWEGNRRAGESDLWAYAKIYCCPKNISIGVDVDEYLAVIAIKSNTFFDRQNEILHTIDLKLENPELNEFVRTYDTETGHSVTEIWIQFLKILEQKFDAEELPTSLG